MRLVSVLSSGQGMPTDGRAGYPRWFATLFLTDMWERFSFYGMAAVLALFAAAPARDGGLGLSETTASALFGAYLGLTFVLSLPGGWVGDRLLGSRRAALVGGCVIAVGHFTMALPARGPAYVGLALIAIGTGLLKPNMLALFKGFYPSHERFRQEAAFSVFFISIQVSALVAPLVTGLVGQLVGWHAAFTVAGVGMTFGVIQFAAGRRHFRAIGSRPEAPLEAAELRRIRQRTVAVAVLVTLLVTVDTMAGKFSILHVLALVGLSTVLAPTLYVWKRWREYRFAGAERDALRAFVWLLLSFAAFWALVSQGGSILILFAERSTDRSLFGIVVPAGWFQSVIPLTILVLAPGFAGLWLWLGDAVGPVVKFASALALAGLSFLVMAAAAAQAGAGAKVSAAWVIGALALQATGEVVIGPAALATSASVAPTEVAGQTMSLPWLFSAVGAALGSQLVHLASVISQSQYYLVLSAVAGGAGIALVAARRRISRALLVTGANSRSPADYAGVSDPAT